mgnify:FL=1
MKNLTKMIFQALGTAAVILSSSAMAQTSMEHGKAGSHQEAMGVTTTPAMTDGEIRKIDKETGKITIKHGAIKHMDMPPMSMVFNVKDKGMLDKVQVGEKIQFIVIQDTGKMVVTDIQPAK